VPVAILSALGAEIQTLVDSATDLERADIGTWPVWSGVIDGQDVILAKAGLGKVNTAALAGIIWERHHPETMLFAGVAGGLDPSLGIGDIVIGERTIQHDWGVIASDGFERYQAGHFPFYNPTEIFGFTPSTQLVEAMRVIAASVELTPVLDRDPKITFGTILTGDQFLQDEHLRDQLFSELGAQAIEMEGAALGQTAARLGVDHLVIRSLSDLAAGESVEHFDRFVPQVAANSAHLVVELLRRL
jgi:adenosylhomocysteine nucleosidase